MSDMRNYKRVKDLLKRCEIRGIETAFNSEHDCLILFPYGGYQNRVRKFESAADLEKWLEGYDFALEYGREEGSKL